MEAANTFLAMLMEANAIVGKAHRGAQFYEADLNIAMAGSPWRFVFNVPGAPGKINGTAILSNYMGKFQLPPKFIDEPWVEDRIIPLPVRLDLSEAQNLAKQAGYGGHIAYITLRFALYPGVNEPSYVFGIPSQRVHVFVGVNSRKVSTQPME